MLLGVFYDLKHFLFFFLFVITAFTMMFEIVLFSSHSPLSEAKEGDDYIYSKYLDKDSNSARSDFIFFLLSMRESIGDYDTDTLTNRDATNFPFLSWTLWFIVMLVGNIVFMNFIIAVVSESYEKCMQSMNAESYR
jgi:Ion transport protein